MLSQVLARHCDIVSAHRSVRNQLSRATAARPVTHIHHRMSLFAVCIIRNRYGYAPWHYVTEGTVNEFSRSVMSTYHDPSSTGCCRNYSAVSKDEPARRQGQQNPAEGNNINWLVYCGVGGRMRCFLRQLSVDG
ncbi:hypothetical protein M0804_001121 [Polistes exclamans]|nr:hypothetical protein M0804_001121 [Polistes exclamans]